jgi:hypothetical protein
VFLLLLWWGVSRFGIEGAAFVWMARVGVDAALLYWMTRLVAGSRAPWRPMILALGAGGVLMIVGALVEGTWGRLAFLTMALPVSMAGAWQFLLGASEREAVRATVLAVTLRRRA